MSGIEFWSGHYFYLSGIVKKRMTKSKLYVKVSDKTQNKLKSKDEDPSNVTQLIHQKFHFPQRRCRNQTIEVEKT